MTEPEFRRAVSATAAGEDYFEIFGIARAFEVDVDDLGRRYLELSKEVHPDRFINAPARERLVALQRSMRLNDAYKTLKKPIPRAEYLLASEGVTIGTHEKLGPGFLMEVMELREELQQAKLAGDRDKLDELEDSMLDRRDAALATVGELFGGIYAGGEQGDGEDRDRLLGQVKKHLIELRYMARYLDELDELDDEDSE